MLALLRSRCATKREMGVLVSALREQTRMIPDGDSEDCCWNYPRYYCPLQRGPCSCACHNPKSRTNRPPVQARGGGDEGEG